MRSYIIRRLIFGVILIFMATIIAFTILKASPGKAGGLELDPRLSEEYIQQQNRLYGLDRSPVEQYLSWIGGVVQGDLGVSIVYKQPVSSLVSGRLVATLTLNIVTLLFTWLIAVPLGIYAAVRQYKWPDKFLSSISFIGMSLPGFFLALLFLLVFAGLNPWLPPGGLRSLDHDNLSFFGKILDYAHHLVIPVVVLTFGALAGLQRISRGNMLEVLRQQYITTARAKGLSEKRVIYRHALRNAINPLITILGFQFAALFGGAALLEIVLNYPGMGQLMLEALRAKDQHVVMSVFLIGSIMLVIGNLVAEILLAWVDPRVSYA